MTSRVVSMTLCRSRMPNSRAQREVAVCEVALDSDRLSGSLNYSPPNSRGRSNAARLRDRVHAADLQSTVQKPCNSTKSARCFLGNAYLCR